MLGKDRDTFATFGHRWLRLTFLLLVTNDFDGEHAQFVPIKACVVGGGGAYLTRAQVPVEGTDR